MGLPDACRAKLKLCSPVTTSTLALSTRTPAKGRTAGGACFCFNRSPPACYLPLAYFTWSSFTHSPCRPPHPQVWALCSATSWLELPKQEIGHFYDGSSYVVLHTYSTSTGAWVMTASTPQPGPRATNSQCYTLLPVQHHSPLSFLRKGAPLSRPSDKGVA